jgi:hypothetical protein
MRCVDLFSGSTCSEIEADAVAKQGQPILALLPDQAFDAAASTTVVAGHTRFPSISAGELLVRHPTSNTLCHCPLSAVSAVK